MEARKPGLGGGFLPLFLPPCLLLAAVDLIALPWAGDAVTSQTLHLWRILRQHKEDSATLEAIGCLQEAR